MHLVFTIINDVYVYLHIDQGSEIKWSLDTHVETHVNARCEQGPRLPMLALTVSLIS